MYQKVEDFFVGVAKRESNTMDLIALSKHQVAFSDSKLVFTLRGLYDILELSEDQSYTEFRKMLYSSHLNTDLAAHGYRVDLLESTKKVDSSWYQLIPINQ